MHSHRYKTNANDSPVTLKTGQTEALFNALKGIKHMQSVRISRATSAALLLTTAFAWNLPAVAETVSTQVPPARAATLDGKGRAASNTASDAAKGDLAPVMPGASAPDKAHGMQESHKHPSAVFGGGKPAAATDSAAKGSATK